MFTFTIYGLKSSYTVDATEKKKAHDKPFGICSARKSIVKSVAIRLVSEKHFLERIRKKAFSCS